MLIDRRASDPDPDPASAVWGRNPTRKIDLYCLIIIGTASGLAENFNLAPSVQGLVPKMNGGIGYINQYVSYNNQQASLGNTLTEVGFQDAYTSFLGSSPGNLQALTPIMPVIYKDTGSIWIEMAGLY
jgi:hypothetical protein